MRLPTSAAVLLALAVIPAPSAAAEDEFPAAMLDRAFVLRIDCDRAPDQQPYADNGTADSARDDRGSVHDTDGPPRMFDAARAGCDGPWHPGNGITLSVSPGRAADAVLDPAWEDRATRAATYGFITPGADIYKGPAGFFIDEGFPGQTTIAAAHVSHAFQRANNTVMTAALIANYQDAGTPHAVRGCTADHGTADDDNGRSMCALDPSGLALTAPADLIDLTDKAVRDLHWVVDCEIPDRSACEQASDLPERARVHIGTQRYAIRDTDPPELTVTTAAARGPGRLIVHARDLIGVGTLTITTPDGTDHAVPGFGCGIHAGEEFTSRIPCPDYNPARPNGLRDITRSVPVPADLADGTHELTVTARDALGNPTRATVTITVDRTPPTLTPADDTAHEQTVTFAVTDNLGALDTCQITYRAAGTLEVTTMSAPVRDGRCTATLPQSTDPGRYHVTAQATDPAGNIGRSTGVIVAVGAVPLPGPITLSGNDLTVPVTGPAALDTCTLALHAEDRTGHPLRTIATPNACQATVPADLPPGPYTLTGTLTDTTGTRSRFDEDFTVPSRTVRPGPPSPPPAEPPAPDGENPNSTTAPSDNRHDTTTNPGEPPPPAAPLQVSPEDENEGADPAADPAPQGTLDELGAEALRVACDPRVPQDRPRLTATVTARDGRLDIRGRLRGPQAHAPTVTLKRFVTCKQTETVAHLPVLRNGTFRGSLPAPENLTAGLYRVQGVARAWHTNATIVAFTLPHVVALR